MDVHRLEAVLRALGAKTSVAGNKVRCSCLLAPWTHPGGRDEKPSMVVYPESRRGGPTYGCLGCHEKGMLRDLLCLIWHKTGQNTCKLIEVLDGEVEQIPEGIDPRARRQRIKVQQATHESVKRKRVKRQAGDGPWFDHRAIDKAKEVDEIPWEVYEPHAGSVPPYALERGLTIETCREWELGHDRYMKRLLIPMRDRDGRLVAVSGRIYVDGCPWCGHKTFVRPEGAGKSKDRCGNCGAKREPKYRHNKGFQRNLHLYGEHMATSDELVYVVEGHLDVLMLWQAGYRDVVALLGSEPGEAQVEKLVAWWRRIIIVPDGDQGGDYMAGKLKHMVAGRVPTTIRRPPQSLDPGKMTPPQYLELLGPPQAMAA